MSKEVNNLKSAPKGQVDKKTDEEKDISKLSRDKLKEKVIEESKKLEPKIEEPTEEPGKEIPEETEELPEELKGKTAKELAEMYQNLRKLKDSQITELGELRKEIKEKKELKEKMESYQINSAKDHIIRQAAKMSPEEKEKFFEKLSESPDEALNPLITKIISPFLVIQARNNNEMAISKLKKDTKDSLIPYEKYENEINEVLNKYSKSGRNQLFDKYGSGAFEEAYNIVYKKHIKEEREKEKKEITKKAKEEAEEDLNKRKNTFTEPQGKSSASKGGKPINYEDMDKEQLDKLVGKPNDD